ncbi:YesL family protein [Parablautia muri]|uniref:YesL family protein n=1 Tax=Parablautia muri TaxID=2320879 RepID=UPI001369C250|nr:YesL family protein [Parablautia muri]
MKLSMDSPVFNIADQIADILVAGFLWLVFSVPVFTIGPASAALYYTVVKVVRRKRETVTKSFLYAFRLNLKQGIGLTILYLVYGAVLAIFISYMRYGALEINPYIAVLTGIIAAAPFLFTLPYIFPVLSRFQFKVSGLLQYALHMSIGHFITTGILLVMLLIVVFFIYLFPFFLGILPGIYAYGASFLIERVFKNYLKAEREKYGEEDELPWYLE